MESKCPFSASVHNDSAQTSNASVLKSAMESSQTENPENFTWSNMLDVASHICTANYEEVLLHTSDERIRFQEPKKLCANGFISSIRIDWFENTQYSGLFEGPSIDHGVIRLSTALFVDQASLPWYARAVSSAKMFPCVALKFSRTNSHSGNILLAGKKTGQDDILFFKNAVCSHLTEKVPILLSWVQNAFAKYSQYAMQLGLSDFASVKQNGDVVADGAVTFPWCIALYAPSENSGNSIDIKSVPFTELGSVPVGTILYDIYAFPSPMAALDANNCGTRTLQRIGRVVTTSALTVSDAHSNIFFKHQRKEEDYALQPEWVKRDKNSSDCALSRMGSTYLQNLVQAGEYVDFEKY